MRKFTKEHNELDWLFPVMSETQEARVQIAEDWFDKYERVAKYYLSVSENDKLSQEEQDRLVDAFMKGASISHQFFVEEYTEVKTLEKLYKSKNELDAFYKKIHEVMDEQLENAMNLIVKQGQELEEANKIIERLKAELEATRD